MDIGWPQIIVICLWSIGFGIHAVKHDDPIVHRDGPPRYNAAVKLAVIAIWASILYWGGFFT